MFKLVCLLLVGVVAAQERCCEPHQWEGYIDSFDGSVRGSDRANAQAGIAQVHLDYTNKTFAFSHEVYDRTGQRTFYRIVDNFQRMKRYFVMDDFCVIRPLNASEERSPCIPSTAQPTSRHVYGGGASRLSVQGWRDDREGEERHYHVTDTCIPVNGVNTFISRNPREETSYIDMFVFNNITPGIKSEEVFETPRECIAVRTMPKFLSTEFNFLLRVIRMHL